MTDTTKYEKKFASFMIDGQKRNVCYSFNSLCEMEDIAGCNLTIGMNNLTAAFFKDEDDGMPAPQPTGKELRGLLAAWMVPFPSWPDDLAKQLDYAGQMLRPDTVDPIKIALVEACSAAISDEIGEKFHEAVLKAEAEAKAKAANKTAIDGVPSVPVERDSAQPAV